MNDATHDYWLAYARMLADKLGLRDWTVRLDRESGWDDQSIKAHVSVASDSKHATVTFGPTFGSLPTDDQRVICIHELLHLHLDKIMKRVEMASDTFDDNSLMSVLPDLVRHEIEWGVDAIAVAIAPLLPAPDPPETT